MSTSETIITCLVIVAVIGQFVFIQWCRRRYFGRPQRHAKQRAELIEREFDKQTGDTK